MGVEHRVGNFPELCQNGLQGHLRSALALGVAAHAIDHHHEHCPLTHGNRYAILVVVPVANEAELGALELQTLSPLFLLID